MVCFINPRVIEIIKHYFNICINSSLKLPNISIFYQWLLEQIDQHRFSSDQRVLMYVFLHSSESSVSKLPRKVKEARKRELLLGNYYRPSWSVGCWVYQFFPCYTDQIGTASAQNMMSHTTWASGKLSIVSWSWKDHSDTDFICLLSSYLWS